MRVFTPLSLVLVACACLFLMKGSVQSAMLEKRMERLCTEHGLGEPLMRARLRQAWMEKPSADFEPGIAQIHATAKGLVVLAILGDGDIGNAATALNQRMWETGDVFEFFIQTAEDLYYEIHVTPENKNLFLRWTPTTIKEARAQKIPFETAMIPDAAFARSGTFVDEKARCWGIYLFVPYAHLGMAAAVKQAGRARVAFARYDAAAGKAEPVYSASADFPRLDFHDRAYWHDLSIRTPCN